MAEYTCAKCQQPCGMYGHNDNCISIHLPLAKYPTIHFKQMIFMGSAGKNNNYNSERACSDLHRLVDEALSTLSGLQQGTDPGGEAQEELIDCLVQVCRAFGYHVDTWKHLPYG